MLCHACHACHLCSCHLMSCHVILTTHGKSYHCVKPCHAMPCHHVKPCHVIMSKHAMSSCQTMPCHPKTTSCNVISGYDEGRECLHTLPWWQTRGSKPLKKVQSLCGGLRSSNENDMTVCHAHGCGALPRYQIITQHILAHAKTSNHGTTPAKNK